MRWITFLILLYLAAGLTAAHFLGLPHSGTFFASPRIEYVLILVIFYSLFGDEMQAPLFALAAGLALDLIDINDVMGVRTMAMGLMSLAIVKIRLSIFREQIFSQMIVTFLAVMLFAGIVGLLLFLSPDPLAGSPTTRGAPAGATAGQMGVFRFLGLMFGNAIYTGVVSPAFFWLLLKMRGMMGIAVQAKRGR